MFININKLKPYRFIEDRILQLILAKISDLVTNKPIQTKELEPLPIQPEIFQLIEFEPINNLLVHGSIKGTNVLVQYCCDVPIEENNATIINYQSDAFNKAFNNVYILEVYTLKVTSIHSHMVITN